MALSRPRPLMLVVGGPSGSGKSTAFPVSRTGLDHFNVDDRCAELNGGSYQGISKDTRNRASYECEAFIEAHIQRQESFAVETTLRRLTPFVQAQAAKANRFVVNLLYLAIERDLVVGRIAIRADAGGLAARPEEVLAIYDASVAHLAKAILEFDEVAAFDNSQSFGRPRLVLEAQAGRITRIQRHPPAWLSQALRETGFQGALAP